MLSILGIEKYSNLKGRNATKNRQGIRPHHLKFWLMFVFPKDYNSAWSEVS